MTKSPEKTLVAIATYNEIENLPALMDALDEHAPDVDILIIDDNSPDGTGRWCDARAASEPRLRCLHRPAKEGLGTATLAGFRYALQQDYDYVITMDADFSHHPRYLPRLRASMRSDEHAKVDVAIGSRYVEGGRVEGWPWYRRIMSRAINAYARWILGLQVADCSGAFRCYRTETLRHLDLNGISSTGYAYLEEILWLLVRQGARLAETPITFLDRQRGHTKINCLEAITAVLAILKMGLFRRTVR